MQYWRQLLNGMGSQFPTSRFLRANQPGFSGTQRTEDLVLKIS